MRAYNDDILHDYHVIHDSGANCGIFKNINILENIRISNEKATINGIGGNLTTNVIGTFNDRHDVYYHPDATEIWSLPFFEKCTPKCTLFLPFSHNRVKMSVYIVLIYAI